MKDSESFQMLEIPSRYKLRLQRNLDVLIYFFWSDSSARVDSIREETRRRRLGGEGEEQRREPEKTDFLK